MKKQLKILRYFIYMAVLLIGIVIGIAIRHYKDIPIAEEINLVDIATLVVTVFLAVYIPEVLDRRLQSTRDKKLLIELRIAEFQTLLKKVNVLIQNNDTLDANSHLTVQNTLDVAKNKLETIASLIKYADLKGSFNSDIGKLRSLTEKHHELLTGSYGTDSVFNYPAGIKIQEEELYNEIDKTSSILILSISNV